MPQVVFIGDEVTAAGFRLAGVPALAPEPGDLARVVAEARQGCRLLLLTAAAEAALPARLRAQLSAATGAMVAVVPDVRDPEAVPDREGAVRRALGLETDG